MSPKQNKKQKIKIPTLKEIAEENANSLKLPEGINIDNFFENEDESDGADIMYQMPDWMEKLFDEHDKGEKSL